MTALLVIFKVIMSICVLGAALIALPDIKDVVNKERKYDTAEYWTITIWFTIVELSLLSTFINIWW